MGTGHVAFHTLIMRATSDPEDLSFNGLMGLVIPIPPTLFLRLPFRVLLGPAGSNGSVLQGHAVLWDM